MPPRAKKPDPSGELLVALLKTKADFAILQEQGWYRIPLASALSRWPPRWLAFYQPKAFGDEAYAVRHYGKIKSIQVVERQELFPLELPSALSKKQYYRIELESLEDRGTPIPSPRPRRLVFIPSTWNKFALAEQINDLFDDSPREDDLWAELKRLKIAADWQWVVETHAGILQLDFGLFCKNGQIDVETDADTWHTQPDQAQRDNQRSNAVENMGWNVLRFSTRQIRERMQDECLSAIQYQI